MSIIKRKHFFEVLFISFLLLLTNCQLKDPKKVHGINALTNKEKLLIVDKTNKNDVIKLIGNPHTQSLTDENTWIYFERTITRGKLVRLGQNVLKKNNVLELNFDKYGILQTKKIYDKNDMKKVKYSKNETENNISQPSFVGKFLSSMKQKMYGKRKKSY